MLGFLKTITSVFANLSNKNFTWRRWASVLSLDVIDSNGSLVRANRTVMDDLVMGDKNHVYLLNSRYIVKENLYY